MIKGTGNSITDTNNQAQCLIVNLLIALSIIWFLFCLYACIECKMPLPLMGSKIYIFLVAFLICTEMEKDSAASSTPPLRSWALAALQTFVCF